MLHFSPCTQLDFQSKHLYRFWLIGGSLSNGVTQFNWSNLQLKRKTIGLWSRISTIRYYFDGSVIILKSDNLRITNTCFPPLIDFVPGILNLWGGQNKVDKSIKKLRQKHSFKISAKFKFHSKAKLHSFHSNSRMYSLGEKCAQNVTVI